MPACAGNGSRSERGRGTGRTGRTGRTGLRAWAFMAFDRVPAREPARHASPAPRGPSAAPGPAGRVPCAARAGGASRNSPRELRSLRSDRARRVRARSALRAPPPTLRCSAPHTARGGPGWRTSQGWRAGGETKVRAGWVEVVASPPHRGVVDARGLRACAPPGLTRIAQRSAGAPSRDRRSAAACGVGGCLVVPLSRGRITRGRLRPRVRPSREGAMASRPVVRVAGPSPAGAQRP